MPPKSLLPTFMTTKLSPNDERAAFESRLRTARRPHDAFAASRIIAHIPRHTYLERLDRHVGNFPEPLVILAPPGAGKSALVTYWIERYRAEHPERFTLSHYVGSGEGAIDHIDLITHVMLEIEAGFPTGKSLPATAERLIADFPAWLWYARRPTILLIDAIDQLPPESRSLDWLPANLPPQLNMILTTRDPEIAARFGERGAHILELAPLTHDERQKLVRRFVAERRAGLTAVQQRAVTRDVGSGNPLLLTTRLEEVNRAATTRAQDEAIEYYLAATTLEEMYDRLLARLETELDPDVLRDVFAFLWGTESGLAPEELATLTDAGNDAVRRVLERIDPYLISTNRRLSVVHTSLAGAAERRWLVSGRSAQSIRRRLADYFETLPPTVRATRELMHQFGETGQLERQTGLVTDIRRFVACFDELRYEIQIALKRADDSFDLPGAYVSNLEAYAKTASHAELIHAQQTVGRLLEVMGYVDTARSVYSAVLAQSVTANDLESQALALIHLGNMQTRRGNYAEAERTLEQALAMLHELGDERGAATAAGDLGTVAFHRGDYMQARDLFLNALSMAEEMSEATEASRIRANLAGVYIRLGRYEDAELTYRQLLADAERTGDIAGEMITAGNLGVLNDTVGNLDRAMSLFRRSGEIAALLGDKRQSAFVHANLANLFVRIQRPDEGLEHAVQQRMLAEELGDRVQLANALTNSGTARTMRAEFPEASRAFESALATYRKINDTYGEGLVLGRLGYLALRTQDAEAAEQFSSEELNIAVRYDHTLMRLEALAGMGHALREQGRLTEARGYYTALRQASFETGSQKRLIEAEASIGVIDCRSGDVALGLEGLDKAVAQSASPSEDLAFWLFEKARVLLTAGDSVPNVSRSERETQALHALERLLDMDIYDTPGGIKSKARSLAGRLQSESAHRRSTKV